MLSPVSVLPEVGMETEALEIKSMADIKPFLRELPRKTQRIEKKPSKSFQILRHSSVRLALKRSLQEQELQAERKEREAKERDRIPSLSASVHRPQKGRPRKKRRLPQAVVKKPKSKPRGNPKRKKPNLSKNLPISVTTEPGPTVEAGSAGCCLCLGMVYAKISNNVTKTGSQAMRDRPRLVALERSLGYDVHTLDITHDPKIAVVGASGVPRHCNANWNTSSRFFKTLWDTWTGKKFSCVIMDYVRTPTGWTITHITRSFYRKTLPRMCTVLTEDGRVFLPNLPGIYEQIKKTPVIRKKYYIRLVKSEFNPLFRATRDAREALRNVTGYTNEGEVGKLCFAADTSRKLPFIMLKKRQEGGKPSPQAISLPPPVSHPSTPALFSSGDSKIVCGNRKALNFLPESKLAHEEAKEISLIFEHEEEKAREPVPPDHLYALDIGL